MRSIMQLLIGSATADHHAVFSAFGAGLARMLRRSARRARVRAVGS